MEQHDKSRGSFLKAGLLVGGALYADPAAALARSGGQAFDFEPNSFYYPKSTEISKFVPGSLLPGNTGQLTLGDLSGLADLNAGTLSKMSRKFATVTLGDIGDCVDYAIKAYGPDQTLFAQQSGTEVLCACCCCSCCVTITLNRN